MANFFVISDDDDESEECTRGGVSMPVSNRKRDREGWVTASSSASPVQDRRRRFPLTAAGSLERKRFRSEVTITGSVPTNSDVMAMQARARLAEDEADEERGKRVAAEKEVRGESWVLDAIYKPVVVCLCSGTDKIKERQGGTCNA